MRRADLERRLRGALLGFALGDCLGAPALPDRTQQAVQLGDIKGPLPAPANHPRWPGLAAGSATWLGDQAQALLVRLAAGEPNPGWDAFAPLPGELVAPIAISAWPAALWGLHGLLWPGRPDQAARDALARWRGPPLGTAARAGIAMIAAALATALARADVEDILGEAQAAALHGRAGEPLGTAPSLPYRLQQATAPLAAAADMGLQTQQLYDFPGASDLAAEAVPTALALVRTVSAQPVWAGLYAANVGGEAALIGAIAGAVAGAAAGEEGMPAAWRQIAVGAWPAFPWDDVVAGLCDLASRISE